MNVLINRWLRLIALALLLFKGQATQSATVVLDRALHHLGTRGDPEWEEFARDRAEGRSLELRFRAKDNPREATLLLRQRDVKLDWNVSLNGRSIGRLYLMEADLEHVLTLPAHALRDGENVLGKETGTRERNGDANSFWSSTILIASLFPLSGLRQY